MIRKLDEARSLLSVSGAHSTILFSQQITVECLAIGICYFFTKKLVSQCCASTFDLCLLLGWRCAGLVDLHGFCESVLFSQISQ